MDRRDDTRRKNWPRSENRVKLLANMRMAIEDYSMAAVYASKATDCDSRVSY